MTWAKKYRDRMMKLIRHLEKGKLGHKVFDFSVGNTNGDGKPRTKPYKCGTNGCAIGECPILFPRAWHFSKCGCPKLRSAQITEDALMDWDNMQISAAEFFGISHEEVTHCFCPDSQKPYRYGGETLPEEATRHQVAANLRAFVKYKDGKK